MSISMACPACGKTLAAPDSAVGKRAKCPACGQIMIVPEAQPEGASGGPAPPSASSGSQPVGDGKESSLDGLGGPNQAAATGPADAGGDARRPCPECGEMIMVGAAKCRFCGATFDPRLRRAGGRRGTGQSYSGMAITSMVCGIAALPGLCAYAWPGIILAIVAITFACVAMSGMRKSGNEDGKGMAISGLVLGLVAIAIAVLCVIAWLAVFNSIAPRFQQPHFPPPRFR